jgi:hypothetical protein
MEKYFDKDLTTWFLLTVIVLLFAFGFIGPIYFLIKGMFHL